MPVYHREPCTHSIMGHFSKASHVFAGGRTWRTWRKPTWVSNQSLSLNQELLSCRVAVCCPLANLSFSLCVCLHFSWRWGFSICYRHCPLQKPWQYPVSSEVSIYITSPSSCDLYNFARSFYASAILGWNAMSRNWLQFCGLLIHSVCCLYVIHNYRKITSRLIAGKVEIGLMFSHFVNS